MRALLPVWLGVVGLAVSGCGGVDTSYGRSNTKSINGTGAFADLLRQRGHTVRVAVRLTDSLRDWADVVVRFAPTAGPPDAEENAWYNNWLNLKSGCRLIYVPNDFNGTVEYWKGVLADLPPDASARLRERVEQELTSAETSVPRPIVMPPRPAKPKSTSPPTYPIVPSPSQLFHVQPATGGKTTCKTLDGPWAEGVDASKAALPKHEALKVDEEIVLLRGDDQPLVISWIMPFNRSRVLVAANGSFLLNVTLAEPDRRLLSLRTARWVGGEESADEDEYVDVSGPERPKNVAFVEGYFVTAENQPQPSVFALLTVQPFGWVAAQLFALGLAACLARAPRLGRARPEEPSGADRPVAHPEALGLLLARTGQANEARSILETYRRWRTGPTSRGSGRGISMN
jgi:hypothetical protein